MAFIGGRVFHARPLLDAYKQQKALKWLTLMLATLLSAPFSHGNRHQFIIMLHNAHLMERDSMCFQSKIIHANLFYIFLTGVVYHYRFISFRFTIFPYDTLPHLKND